MIVYLVENKRNGKRYVGLTKHDLDTRWGQHVKDALHERSNMLLHKAIRKHGPNGFVRVVIDTGQSEEQLRELEKSWIEALGTHVSRGGYNLTLGGDGLLGYKHSEETKQKMSESRKGERNPNFGKHWGKLEWSEEDRQKLAKKRMGEDNPFKGKHHSEEARKKIGDAQFKKVAQCDDEGRTIGVFNSVIEAATKLAPSEKSIYAARTGIARACKYPTRRALGFKWKYLENQKG